MQNFLKSSFDLFKSSPALGVPSSLNFSGLRHILPYSSSASLLSCFPWGSSASVYLSVKLSHRGEADGINPERRMLHLGGPLNSGWTICSSCSSSVVVRFPAGTPGCDTPPPLCSALGLCGLGSCAWICMELYLCCDWLFGLHPRQEGPRLCCLCAAPKLHRTEWGSGGQAAMSGTQMSYLILLFVFLFLSFSVCGVLLQCLP